MRSPVPAAGIVDYSVVGWAASAPPIVAFGNDVPVEIADPQIEFLTFEGFLAHALAVAAERGILKEHDSLAFLPLGASRAGQTDFGAARLDDAVLASVLARPVSLGLSIPARRGLRLMPTNPDDR